MINYHQKNNKDYNQQQLYHVLELTLFYDNIAKQAQKEISKGTKTSTVGNFSLPTVLAVKVYQFAK